jgi:hypothetical protein
MNKLKLVFVIIVVFSTIALNAQTVRLINSTQQSWSGGIAGRHGANYTFKIEFSDYKKEPSLETIWIGQSPFPIVLVDSGTLQRNTRRTPRSNSVIFDINASTSFDDNAEQLSGPEHREKVKKSRSHMSYDGVALLSYKYKGKRRYYAITNITKTYPPVNYP